MLLLLLYCRQRSNSVVIVIVVFRTPFMPPLSSSKYCAVVVVVVVLRKMVKICCCCCCFQDAVRAAALVIYRPFVSDPRSCNSYTYKPDLLTITTTTVGVNVINICVFVSRLILSYFRSIKCGKKTYLNKREKQWTFYNLTFLHGIVVNGELYYMTFYMTNHTQDERRTLL